MKYIIVFIIMIICYQGGRKDERDEIKKRALKIEKECYTNRDIEIIVFGETQE